MHARRYSNELRDELDQRGTEPVIPNRSNRKRRFSFSKRLYKLQWRIESAFNKLKDFRCIATRYDKLARNYLAAVCSSPCMTRWNQLLVHLAFGRMVVDTASFKLRELHFADFLACRR
jgi:hypothetical protein